MSIGSVLKREFVVSVGRGALFRDRLLAAGLAGGAVVACLGVWDWNGWDRRTVAGARLFGHVAFGIVVAAQVCMAVGFVLPSSRSIASERDRKTLDALLATRLSSAEVVLGVMAASLFRFANAMLATAPMVVLLVYLGGVDPALTLLAAAGMASTAVGVAALSAAASVECRTATRGTAAAVAMVHAWFTLPALLLMIRAFFLPPLPGWLVAPVLCALDASPLGVAANLAGVLPRPWGLAEGVARMAAYQAVGASAMTAWAIARLRPASRSLYDLEGRAGVLRAVREANRRLPRRPPCGEDPVFWNEAYGQMGSTRAARAAGVLVRAASILLFAVGAWWFVAPAFVELAARGYGPSPEAYSMPEGNPLTRVIAERLVLGASLPPAPGQARLEFNLALRQCMLLLSLAFVMGALANGVEGVAREQRRETWLGLLATPLTGAEILRGKVLGALWRCREVAAIILTLFAAGLATGAVHPLGFLASVAWMAACGPLFAAMGTSTALRSDGPPWPLEPTGWPRALAAVLASVIFMTTVPLTLASTSLFTYEDLRAAAAGGPFTPFERTFLRPWIGARGVVLIYLVLMAGTAARAFVFLRSLAREFDALVGRAQRPPEGTPAPAEAPASPSLQAAAP